MKFVEVTILDDNAFEYDGENTFVKALVRIDKIITIEGLDSKSSGELGLKSEIRLAHEFKVIQTKETVEEILQRIEAVQANDL